MGFPRRRTRGNPTSSGSAPHPPRSFESHGDSPTDGALNEPSRVARRSLPSGKAPRSPAGSPRPRRRDSAPLDPRGPSRRSARPSTDTRRPPVAYGPTDPADRGALRSSTPPLPEETQSSPKDSRRGPPPGR